MQKKLVISGDGRYYNQTAIQKIIKLTAARGFGELIIGQHGLMATPAISAYIRWLNEQEANSCPGGIILTGCHNPGGEEHDFGVRLNLSNGGPATISITDQFYAKTKTIQQFWYADIPDVDLTYIHKEEPFKIEGFDHVWTINIVSTTENYVNLVKNIFDFPMINEFLLRTKFNFVFDGMNGVSGPYAIDIFNKELGVPLENLHNWVPLQDFGGGNPQQNLTFWTYIENIMGIDSNSIIDPNNIPDFGAALDVDADWNRVFGKGFSVLPADTLAIFLNQHKAIKSLKEIKGVARTMPTSQSADNVAKNTYDCYETPTGWKYFVNLLDSNKISLWGEESFGIGSDHIREKDGIWTILAWLSIIAAVNKSSEPSDLITLKHILEKHWEKYGRNYYCKYDYEEVDQSLANEVFSLLTSKFTLFESEIEGGNADNFEFYDHIEDCKITNQGLRFIYPNGSRFIFRMSGTSCSGVTIRVYFEKFDKENIHQQPLDALRDISKY